MNKKTEKQKIDTISETIEECVLKPENITAGRISREDINQTYVEQVSKAKLNLDCLWTIEVKPGWGVRNFFFCLFIIFVASSSKL